MHAHMWHVHACACDARVGHRSSCAHVRPQQNRTHLHPPSSPPESERVAVGVAYAILWTLVHVILCAVVTTGRVEMPWDQVCLRQVAARLRSGCAGGRNAALLLLLRRPRRRSCTRATRSFGRITRPCTSLIGTASTTPLQTFTPINTLGTLRWRRRLCLPEIGARSAVALSVCTLPPSVIATPWSCRIPWRHEQNRSPSCAR